MKTIGLIIKKNSLSADIPEEKAKLTGEPPENQTEGKPKKPTRKQPKAKKPPEIKAEESPSETIGETDAPDEEKEPENGAE